MERIEQILHRIQGIYYDDRAKTNIDIDLMLDYTRVLYADLLEWKKTVPNIEVIVKLEEDNNLQPEKNSLDDTPIKEEETEENTREDELTNDEITEDEKEETTEIPVEQTFSKEEEHKSTIQSEENTTPPEELEHTEDEEEEEVSTELVSESSEQTMKVLEEINEDNNSKKEDTTVEKIEDEIIYEPSEEPSNMEKTPDDFFFKERPVLSFELPKSNEEIDEEQHYSLTEQKKSSESPTETTNENKDENKDEKIETQNEKIEDSKPSSPEPFEIPRTDFSNLFSAIQPDMTADIRKNIGLNDRYLFLNEMFKNNKPEYDDCLNQINACKSLDEAHNYLVVIAAQNNWNKEDETVESFYKVVAKHFSNR